MDLTPDYFLKIDGIDGESADSKHGGEIQISHFTMGAVNRGRHGDYKVGKAVFDDVRFFGSVEVSYPKLKQACATGEKLPKAVLTCRKAGRNQQDYLRVTLTDVQVTSCKLDAGGETYPVMEFTLSFAKKQIEYKEQKQDGTLGGSLLASFDLRTARAGS